MDSVRFYAWLERRGACVQARDAVSMAEWRKPTADQPTADATGCTPEEAWNNIHNPEWLVGGLVHAGYLGTVRKVLLVVSARMLKTHLMRTLTDAGCTRMLEVLSQLVEPVDVFEIRRMDDLLTQLLKTPGNDTEQQAKAQTTVRSSVRRVRRLFDELYSPDLVSNRNRLALVAGSVLYEASYAAEIQLLEIDQQLKDIRQAFPTPPVINEEEL